MLKKLIRQRQVSVICSELGGLFRRGPSGERGSALMEFAIATPFIVTMILGITDIGRGLQQQFLLQDAVREGAERAMSLPTLASNSIYANTTDYGCTGGYSSTHSTIHDRVQRLITLESNALREPCIVSELKEIAGATDDNTLSVRASAKYNAIFPLFDGVVITAQVKVPYLLDR